MTIDDLAENVKTRNQFIRSTFYLSLGDEVYKLGKASEYIKKDEYGDLLFNDKGNFVFDKEMILEKVKGSKEIFDTKENGIFFRNYFGNTIEVPAGTFGNIMDAEKTMEKLVSGWEKFDLTEKIEPEWVSFMGEISKKSTYVEVSISKQHVWLHENGVVTFDSACVSGDVATGKDTNKGVWYITLMEKDRYLTGPTWNEYVNYWMRFTPDAQGFHDATWRNVFGGGIYKTDGSHGCVNLPLEAAGKLFSLIEEGTPVVVW